MGKHTYFTEVNPQVEDILGDVREMRRELAASEKHNRELTRQVEQLQTLLSEPIPMVLHCPECGIQHIDSGEWATRPHRTHLCLGCAHEWRPANIHTKGVAALTAPPSSSDPGRADTTKEST